ncbi:MAG: AARP2CN domain-containing [Lasallia pustulata]|uniref:AARP2CN domain-containing n=2 Tax=Lasallia pustulata TaxID=136370 RepID=A0A5M8Q1X2_9LECA|nr:MAG: AARP2CN domain-containing [Lasallia pustulata]
MAPIAEAHHHRSTTKASHKPFKSKHSTKGFLKEMSKGKVDDGDKNQRKTPHQQVMSKINRRHQARQKQQSKHHENTKATSVFSGQHGASRIVAVIPVCEDGDARAAIHKLNQGLDLSVEVPPEGLVKVRVDRFKQNVLYIPVARNLVDALDSCRTADFVVFLLSPHQEVDDLGELMIRSIEGQGVSNVLTAVQGLDGIQPAKRQPQVLSSLKSYITHFFPTQEKVHSVDSHQDCANVIRSLCTTTPKGVRWREDRSWMLVEDLQWPSQSGPSPNASGAVVVTGVVRGKSLKSNRLVHIGDWGDFQIDKITAAPLPVSKKRKADEMAVEEQSNTEVTLETPDEDQDDLADLAPHDVSMDDVDDVPVSEAHTEKRRVLLDDHHYFSDDETHLPEAPKRLPKGTSSYQAAWFLGDMSDSGSEDENVVDQDGDLNMGAPALPQDGLEGLDTAPGRDPTEAAPSEYPQSEMFLDPSPNDEAEELAAYRSQRKNEAEEDLEFPDEIELHPNVLARERLARYRGLKSLRTSHWETDEDRAHEPEDWNRLLQIADYKGAKSQALREALVGGVQPGTRVHVHLRNVPLSLQASYSPSKPLALVSFLRHEHKRTVVNYSITLSSDYPNPIRSKEELIMQCGPRRFLIKPLFSQAGNTPNNVHKFDRYLHPGRAAIATFIAPLTWGSVPTLFFKTPSPAETDPSSPTVADAPSSPTLPLELIATGTSLPPDRSRIVAKRVILTGHPYKIHKKLVTVRYMFFNAEDVNWFKALQLWTKRGRSGFVKESLGTHGYFKATFDGKINPQDAVGVSLYKRVFPRGAVAWRPEGSGVVGEV